MNLTFVQFLQIKKKGGLQSIQIISGSMEPWIGTNEKVKVQVCDIEQLSKFDIVVFWENDILVCHILMDFDSNKLVTKGLANEDYDKPVHPSQLLGKVISPKFSWWQRFLLRFQ